MKNDILKYPNTCPFREGKIFVLDNMPSKYTRNDQLLVLNNIHKYLQWNWLWNKAWWSIHVTSPIQASKEERRQRRFFSFFLSFLRRKERGGCEKEEKQPERPPISPRNLNVLQDLNKTTATTASNFFKESLILHKVLSLCLPSPDNKEEEVVSGARK